MEFETKRAWGWLGLSMALGAAYDLAFGVAILFFPAPAAGLLGLALPGDPVYLRLNGVFLLMLAAFYVLPAANPRRYAAIVVVAIGGRFAGFLYLGGVWLLGWPPAFLGLALADLAFSLLHGVLLGLARRAPPGVAPRKS